MSRLTDFIQNDLYPSLFERIDLAFPEARFTRKGNRWSSPLHLDLSPSATGAKERTYINGNSKYPYRVATTDDEGSLSLLDYALQYHNRTQEQLIDELKELCSVCGLELPDGDTEQYKLYRERQDKIGQLYSRMKAALFSDDGKEALRYLREKRGYSDDVIKGMGLGYISKAMANEINEQRLPLSNNPETNKEIEDGISLSVPKSVGSTHVLVIPYFSGGSIRGFKFRLIDDSIVYRDGTQPCRYYNNKGLPKKASLFGLTGLRQVTNGNLVIVEGEFDALHAQAVGLDNVVAAAGGVVSPEALQEAKSRGVKKVTILFDTEETPEKNKETDKKREKAIEDVALAGLYPLVATLPSDGGKVDADSYLRTHEAQQLKDIVSNALSGSMYLFSQIWERHAGESITSEQLYDFKRETITLVNAPYVSAVDRSLILSKFSEITGDKISEEAIRQEADLDKEIQDAQRQNNEALQVSSQAYKLAKDGKTEEAINLMGEKASALRTISRQGEYNRLLALPTMSGIKARLREKPVGITTPYTFGQFDKSEQLILPAGAITFICAPTSHGKSKMLQNLALQIAQNGEEGTVLYFTFEEDAESVIEQMEVNFIGIISRNSLRSIRTYNKGDVLYLNHDLSKLTEETFKEKEAQFMSLLESGKLRLFYKDYDSTELIGAIRYLSQQIKVKAVFVDYVQLLNKRGTRLQRTEELKEICKDFKELAVSTSLPIIMAAQLNREAKSPIEMHSQNIAEAADLERIANTVICMWNSAFTPLVNSNWETKDTNKQGKKVYKSKEQDHIESLGFQLGVKGKIYAKLTKNRGGAVNIDTVLNFDGSTGRITPDVFQEVSSGAAVDDTEKDDDPF